MTFVKYLKLFELLDGFLDVLTEKSKDVEKSTQDTEKIPYPKSVFFIVVNEFCERFNYYGMRSKCQCFITFASIF